MDAREIFININKSISLCIENAFTVPLICVYK